MAATAAFRAESVTFDPIDSGPPQTWTKVQLLTRGGQLHLRTTSGDVYEDREVHSVARTGNRTWRIVSALGTYTATVEKCGRCGGR